MSETPDVSKIVSLIMENPELIEQISGMVKSNGGGDTAADPVKEEKPVIHEVEKAPSEEETRRVHRMKLAQAMKPYLSTERAQAIDAMMSIVDILELTWGKR